MIKKLIDYIKTEFKELLAAGIVLILVILIFMAYLKFVGLPMTRARNTYNEAMIIWTAGDKIRAKQRLMDSLGYWNTIEAQSALKEVNEQLAKESAN